MVLLIISIYLIGFLITARIVKRTNLTNDLGIQTDEMVFISILWPFCLIVATIVGVPYALFKAATFGLERKRPDYNRINELEREIYPKPKRDTHIYPSYYREDTTWHRWEDPTW